MPATRPRTVVPGRGNTVDSVMSNNRFPKRVRLLRAGEFESVFAARNSASDPWIVLYGAASTAGHPRLGLTVSRRVGCAVERNRWKRLLREAFRLSQHDLPALDLICVVRGQSPPDLHQLQKSLAALSHRIKNKIEQRARPVENKPS
jgi:ribonuclease P protein component